MERLFLIVGFILVLVFSRLVPHPPNFTPIIAAAIFGPIFFKEKTLGLAIPILAMFISDLVLGFHIYQFVIYVTLISISLLIPKNVKLLPIVSYGVLSSLWFFFTTNFAVWIAWDYYPKNLEGFLLCFTLAIPFFTNTLLSTISFVILFHYINKFYNHSALKLYLNNENKN